MGSGMNVEQAKEYAKTMTYKQAVSNCFHAKGIMYRKATLIKLHELAEIADKLDKADTLQTDCRTCKWAEVSWTSHYCDDCKAHNKYEPKDTPQTETSTNGEKLQSGVELKQTDCGWK